MSSLLVTEDQAASWRGMGAMSFCTSDQMCGVCMQAMVIRPYYRARMAGRMDTQHLAS